MDSNPLPSSAPFLISTQTLPPPNLAEPNIYMDYLKFKVTPDEEGAIKANPKLAAIAQFINIFKNVLGLHPNAQY
jgi:hypothetical protein